MTQTDPPINLNTELASFRDWLAAHLVAGKPLPPSVRSGVLQQVDLLTGIAKVTDMELDAHRAIMDATHARRLLLRLGAADGTETMQ